MKAEGNFLSMSLSKDARQVANYIRIRDCHEDFVNCVDLTWNILYGGYHKC